MPASSFFDIIVSQKSYKIFFLFSTFLLLIGCRKTQFTNTEFHPVSAKEFIVDYQALTCTNGLYGNIINGQSFQEDAILSYKGWQYIGYYDGMRKICLGRRKLPGNNWEILRFDDFQFSSNTFSDNDSHNTISIGICSKDGTLHLAFDTHATPLNYRVSQKNILDDPSSVSWSNGLFSSVRNYLEPGSPLKEFTYPSFITAPSGDLLLGFRDGYSGVLNYKIVTYDGAISMWKNMHTIISGVGDYQDPFDGISTARYAYLNGLDFDKLGRLQISWVWREAVSDISNRDICYAYSTDNGSKWFNSLNQLVADQFNPNLTAISSESKDIVIKNIDRGWGLVNQQAQAIDNNNKMHTVMYHFKNKKDIPAYATFQESVYFHYFQKNDGSWAETQVPFIGNRPKLLVDASNNLFLFFIRKDHFANSFESAPLIILKALSNDGWKNWQIVYESFDYYFNEVQLDLSRWETNKIASLMLQLPPLYQGQPTALKVIDFKIN